jgi:hypothetical protein
VPWKAELLFRSFVLRRRWVLVPILVGSVAAVFTFRDLETSKAADNQTTSLPGGLLLKLSVAENRNELDVTWNRSVPAIVHAKRGVLSISDGSNKQDLELSGLQLREGRVHYSPQSRDVRLRLEVFPEGQARVDESIRVLR